MTDQPPFQPVKLNAPAHWAHHLLYDTGRYVLDGYIYGTGTLVITFENAQGDFSETDLFRHGWGAKLFRAQKVSHIAVKPKAGDWYQAPCLSPALAKLRAAGLFDQFDNIVTYGTSMGGFAAIAFADQVQATTVLALSPQTTLNRDLVPWEKRFPVARKQTWMGDNNDAVGKSLHAKRVLCVYDMHHPLDRAHVARLDQPNLHHINTPFQGHGIAIPLVKLKAAKPLLAYALGETEDLTPFYAALRGRKAQERYFKQIAGKDRVKTSDAFTKIIKRERKKAGFNAAASKAKTAEGRKNLMAQATGPGGLRKIIRHLRRRIVG